MSKGKHTPGPWRLEGWVDAGNGARVMAADGGPVCRVDGATAWAGVAGTGVRTSRERDANAAFIVRACNSHDELVEALGAIVESAVTDADTCAICLCPLDRHASGCSVAWAAAALAKARGEA